MAALGAANPIAAYTIKGVQTVYGLSLRREILFPIGADIQVQVVRASMLRQKDSWTGWPQLPLDAPLKQLVTAAPQSYAHSQQYPVGCNQPHVHRVAARTGYRFSGSTVVRGGQSECRVGDEGGASHHAAERLCRCAGFCVVDKQSATRPGISEVAQHFCQTSSRTDMEARQTVPGARRMGGCGDARYRNHQQSSQTQSGRIASILILTANVTGWKPICFSSEPPPRTSM